MEEKKEREHYAKKTKFGVRSKKNKNENETKKTVKTKMKKFTVKEQDTKFPIVSDMKKPVTKKHGKLVKVEKPKLKIIPLGGMNEIGKNMTVFEYEDEIIIIDCGLAFPEDEMLGVDLVIPDITYLERNKEKIKAILITHGHEDHIGSIPYVLKKINVPIYGTKLTLGLIKAKLQEHNLDKKTKLKCINPGETVKFKHFKVEFVRVTHSIADSVAMAITTPVGVVLHTGDFKVDFTPIDGKHIDIQRLAEIGRKGVLLLMADSTNALRPGYAMSESSVGKEFDRIFANCNKRIIVATFASNIHRMQQIINSAVKFKRKVAVVGRSMENVKSEAKRS